MAHDAPVVVVVLYPWEVHDHFNMSYYLSEHMPTVLKKLGKFGLKGWAVAQFGPGPDGAEPPYAVQATLYWENEEGTVKANSSPEMKEIIDDVPNFSNKGPLFLGGGIVGRS